MKLVPSLNRTERMRTEGTEDIPAKTGLEAARRPALVLGLALLIIAIASGLFGRGHPGFGRSEILLGLLGAALLAAAAFGWRFVAAYKATALIAMNLIVALVLLELGAGLALMVIARPGGEEPEADRIYHGMRWREVSYYSDQPWAAEYWEEQDKLRSGYEPFVLWRAAPHEGRHVNILADGLRATPGSTCTPNAFRVYVFGGSAAWGLGSPDWGTIPAYLQAELAGPGRPVCVVNYAQNGYVSTQEVVELVRRAQEEDLPDVAIFFDGWNEPMSAWESGRPGLHSNFDRIASLLERRDKSTSRRSFLQGTSVYRLIAQLTAWLRPPPPVSPRLSGQVQETEALVDTVAEIYLANQRIVQDLATSLGFEALSFIQPSIFETGKPLTPEEQKWVLPADDLRTRLLRAFYRRMRTESDARPDLYYLPGIFDGVSEIPWIDQVHLVPPANKLIAERIAREIRARCGSDLIRCQAM
jgi:lysophospholipase L1-like esterase